MPLRTRLLLGPLAGVILLVGIVGLALLVPGYSHVRQTVSEIGEVGSPAQLPFAAMLATVALFTLGFAIALHRLLTAVGRSRLPAYLVGAMAISATGIALFAHPHPLHNAFGISELVGYQAPLAFALTWRRHPHGGSLVALSWILYILIVVAIVLNLSGLLGASTLWSYVQPRYGLAQRLLFAAWFGWSGLVGLLLSASNQHEPRVGTPASHSGAEE